METPLWNSDRRRRWASIRTVDLITTGRRTGRPRRIEIWWFQFEDHFVITGTPGRRDWYANVLSDPLVRIEVGGEAVEARATPVDDRDFRRRFFEHRAASWYASMAELETLVETSPMVTIAPA